MNTNICVLHILREEELAPPENLAAAVRVVSIRAGSAPDEAVRDCAPIVITICGPMDHIARQALARVADLDLPVLGIGSSESAPELRANVSADISSDDLHAMISVMNSCSGLWRIRVTDDPDRPSAYWMEQTTGDFIRMMEHLLALRLPEYMDRADRVVQASYWIGSRIGLDKEQLQDLVYAARLREIGKLGLPDKILFLPRHLRTKEEQTVYDRYPVLGARVMNELSALRHAAKVVEYQLEQFDGGGAGGLISNQIPLGSRVLRVASAFEMIAADNRNDSIDEILSILDKGRGSLYDPQLVRLMENYVRLTVGGKLNNTDTQRVKLSDLVEGMVLAEDVWSRGGIKIVARGTTLNEHMIDVLMSLPLDASIEFVEVKRAS